MFTQKTLDKFTKFFTVIGGAFLNPVDTANENRTEMKRILRIIERDSNIDNLVFILNSRASSGEQFRSLLRSLARIREKAEKPIMVVMSISFSSEEAQQAEKVIRQLQNKGIATFLSLERGARALKRALNYYNMKRH